MDKIQKPEQIDRLDLDKYGLSRLRGKNVLTLTGAEMEELLDALAADDISINVPIPCTPDNVEGILSYSECRRCGGCCLPNPRNPGSPGVELLEEELRAISIALQQPYESLKEKTFEGQALASDYQSSQVTFTRRLPLPCPFYDEKAGACRVYEVRPTVCNVYPIIFGENGSYIAIKVDCEYGRDIAARTLMYLRTNYPDMVLKL